MEMGLMSLAGGGVSRPPERGSLGSAKVLNPGVFQGCRGISHSGTQGHPKRHSRTGNREREMSAPKGHWATILCGDLRAFPQDERRPRSGVMGWAKRGLRSIPLLPESISPIVFPNAPSNVADEQSGPCNMESHAPPEFPWLRDDGYIAAPFGDQIVPLPDHPLCIGPVELRRNDRQSDGAENRAEHALSDHAPNLTHSVQFVARRHRSPNQADRYCSVSSSRCMRRMRGTMEETRP